MSKEMDKVIDWVNQIGRMVVSRLFAFAGFCQPRPSWVSLILILESVSVRLDQFWSALI